MYIKTTAIRAEIDYNGEYLLSTLYGNEYDLVFDSWHVSAMCEVPLKVALVTIFCTKIHLVSGDEFILKCNIEEIREAIGEVEFKTI
jgi:hypothetical protein